MYIRRVDSSYFIPVQHRPLAGHTVTSGHIISMGDFNVQPHITDEDERVYQYNRVRDMVVNSYGRTLVNVWQNNSLLIKNNLSYGSASFKGNW